MVKKHSVISELDEQIAKQRKESGEGNDDNEDEDLDAEDVEELEDDDSEESADDKKNDGKDSRRSPKDDEEKDEDESGDKKKDESDDSEDDDEDDEDDSDDDSDEEEDDDDSAPRKKKPGDVITELKREKHNLETTSKALLDLIGATSLEEATTKLAAMKSSAAPSQEFLDAAKEIGIEDPENIQKLFTLFKTNIEKDVVEGKVKPLEKQLGDIMDAVAPILSANALQKEWEEFQPSIEESFPHASRSQLREARKIMAELAETEAYTNQKMDFILFKEFDKFEDIFGPAKRRTMLPARSRPDAPVEKKSKSGLPEIDPSSHESIMKGRDAMRKIQSSGGDLTAETDNEI